MSNGSTIYKEIDSKLDKIIEKVSAIEQCQAVEKSMLDTLSRLVDKHERILFGDNGDGGLIQDVNAMARAQASAQKVVWIIVTPLLTAIGAGIIYIIFHGISG